MKTLMLTGALGLTLAVGATGCGRGADRLERAEKLVDWKVADAMDDLDATPRQAERAQGLAKGLVVEARPLVKQALEARDVLIAEWKTNKPDSAKVHAVVDSQLDAARGFVHRVADAAIELHGLLTPEQRDEVTARFEKHARH
ncbi:MAG: periplasmic heavy metal sensor [Myxococcales bacterium]|nr:periplasmic heavy metal sensor [Myxococcales bacterium]